MDKLKEHLENRLAHAEERIQTIKDIHAKNPSNTYNYFGGQTLGYWEGMAAGYDLALAKIDDLEKEADEKADTECEVAK